MPVSTSVLPTSGPSTGAAGPSSSIFRPYSLNLSTSSRVRSSASVSSIVRAMIGPMPSTSTS